VFAAPRRLVYRRRLSLRAASRLAGPFSNRPFSKPALLEIATDHLVQIHEKTDGAGSGARAFEARLGCGIELRPWDHASQLWKSFTCAKTSGAGARMSAPRATRNSEGCMGHHGDQYDDDGCESDQALLEHGDLSGIYVLGLLLAASRSSSRRMSTTMRSWVPRPISSVSSRALTLNTMRRPSTCVTSASAVTSCPTGVAAR
jgi:hypothetical protein